MIKMNNIINKILFNFLLDGFCHIQIKKQQITILNHKKKLLQNKFQKQKTNVDNKWGFNKQKKKKNYNNVCNKIYYKKNQFKKKNQKKYLKNIDKFIQI